MRMAAKQDSRKYQEDGWEEANICNIRLQGKDFVAGSRHRGAAASMLG
jgi:hypothetical protein